MRRQPTETFSGNGCTTNVCDSYGHWAVQRDRHRRSDRDVDQRSTCAGPPARRLELRLATFQGQQLGVQAIEANVLTLSSSIASLNDADTFDSVTVSNSDSTQLSVTTKDDAAVGQYSFQAVQLATTEQRLSKGFANSDTQKVGAGTITISQGGELSTSTRLDTFNGGQGVQRGSIRITDRSGTTATIDLSNAFEIDDVLTAINEDTNISVTARTLGGKIVLEDTTGSTASNLIVAEAGTGKTAADLGINQSVASATLTGSEVHYLTGDFTLDQLNDGNGVFQLSGASDLQITLKDATQLDVNLDDIFNVNELLTAINSHSSNGGKLTASLSSGRLVLTDSSGGGGSLSVADINGSSVVEALGLDNVASGNTLTGDRLLAGLGSRLLRNLRGGQGVTTPGSVSLTDRAGRTATVDLSSAESLDEVLDAINSAQDGGTDLALTARLNSLGTGIEVVDTSGSTASNLIVADVGGGSVATDLGIAVNAATTSQDSGALSFRRVGQETSLDGYAPNGEDVQTGSFLITDSSGNQASISITENVTTIGAVIQRINAASTVQVTAKLNETGDGFVIQDDAAGAGSLKVEEVSGTTAADLRILGTGVVGSGGKQEITSRDQTVITVADTDTLSSLSTKINDASAGITAGVLNDGSTFNSFRLALSSDESGSTGRLVIDTGNLDLGLTVTTEAEDGLLQVGANPASSFLVASTDNRYSDVATGINVVASTVSTSAATVTVSRDTSQLKSTLESLVSSYNRVIDTSDELTKFDPDPTRRGILQGQGIVLRVRSRLDTLINRDYFGTNDKFQGLRDLGVRVTSGGKLTFDQDVFDDAAASSPDDVRNFFLDKNNGVSKKLDTSIKTLTDSIDGVFKIESDTLQSTIDSIQDRVEQIDDLLAVRQERLLNEFIQMERLIGSIQSQQNALAALSASRAPQSGGS